jgi:hypothetical protein
MKDSHEQEPAGPGRGKTYSAPVLTEYGSVSKLTSKGGSFVEGSGGKKATSCL